MRIAVAALVALIVVAGCGGTETQNAPSEQTTAGGPSAAASTRHRARPLSGVSLDGEPVALARLRGRPVLINVWSSW